MKTYPSHPMREYLDLGIDARPPTTLRAVESFARTWVFIKFGPNVLVDVRVSDCEEPFVVSMNFEIRGWRSWFHTTRARMAKDLRDMLIHLPCHVRYDIAVFRRGTPWLQRIAERVVGFFRR